MDPVTAKLMSAAGAVDDPVYADDVYGSKTYTGNGGTQTIETGFDLTADDGMVWIKCLDAQSDNNVFDTKRGFDSSNSKMLVTNKTQAELGLTSYVNPTSSGVTLNSSGTDTNESNKTYLVQTFKVQPGFFDIVTYTGNGTAGHNISHSLGSVPGMIWVKRRDSGGNWFVYHRSLIAGSGGKFGTTSAGENYLRLHASYEVSKSTTVFNDTDATSTNFTVGTNTGTNANNGTYVAYLFAHHDGNGEFGENGDEDIISCGSVQGIDANFGTVVDLGYEPQWSLYKGSADNPQGANSDGAQWQLRTTGYAWASENSEVLSPHERESYGGSNVLLRSKGFRPTSSDNSYTTWYIYCAIRRSHKPLAGLVNATDVFSIQRGHEANGYAGSPESQGIDFGFTPDAWLCGRASASDNVLDGPLLLGNRLEYPGRTALTDRTAHTNNFLDAVYWLGGSDSMPTGSDLYMGATRGFNDSGFKNYYYGFKRAAGFFDCMKYQGDGTTNRNLIHNLRVAPELIIIKRQTSDQDWHVWYPGAGHTNKLVLNTNAGTTNSGSIFGSSSSNVPNASRFVVSDSDVDINVSNMYYQAWLWSSYAGISKVGTYSGNSSAVTVDCGFSSGSRFLLIKRVNGTGDWFLYDSLRGLTTGTDPYVLVNSDANGATESQNWVENHNSGFKVNSTAPSGLNGSGNTYLFLAIA